jgi:hypothetical protein
MPRLYDDASVLYDDSHIPYEPAVPEEPQPIETWVTTADGTYIAHLDRSADSPFRSFRFYLERNAPGGGSLEYNPDALVLDDHPTLFAYGNLVHMRYRSRTVTWIIEEEKAALDANESASDWRVVAGRGVLQLLADRLVWPTNFDPDTVNGMNPQAWATQWRSFVNRPAGELLWDLIDESNDRFDTQITRGAVQTTGSDGITIDYRFENLLDDVLVPILEAEGGTVEMDGLEFNYYTSPGTDLSETIIFEEGADLLSAKRNTSEREALTWVVGEGVGEGVFAKLAVADTATHRNPFSGRRREAFLAAKEAGNLPLLQLMTDAALAENAPADGIEASIDETRYKALTDFDFGDTVRVISSSRGIDHTGRIVALYVAEEDDKVRTDFDLDVPRPEPLVTLSDEIRKTRRTLGVTTRQPQGQMTTINGSASIVFDQTTANGFLFDLLDEVYVTVRVKVAVAFRSYFAPATSAASGGGATSGSGGGSSPTTSSGGSSTPTSSTTGAHRHMMFFHQGPGTAASAQQWDVIAGGLPTRVSFNGPSDSLSTYESAADHSHTITVPSHDHSVTIPAHDHTTPAHSHSLVYSLHNEAYPVTHNVSCAIYKRVGSSWSLIATVSGLTDDVEEFWVEQYIDGPGLWRLVFQSLAGQPNNGRLAADVSVAALGAIQSS